eukprot:4978272-Amphidinium_carterae.1
MGDSLTLRCRGCLKAVRTIGDKPRWAYSNSVKSRSKLNPCSKGLDSCSFVRRARPRAPPVRGGRSVDACRAHVEELPGTTVPT